MDRNTVIGIVLILGIFIGYFYLTKPTKEEEIAMKRRQDSISVVEATKAKLEQAKIVNNKNISQKSEKSDSLITNDTIKTKDIKSLYGSFYKSVQGEKKYFTIENEFLRIQLSNLGGRVSRVELKNYKTYKAKPLFLFEEANSAFGYTFFADNRDINTSNFYFEGKLLDNKYALAKDSVVVSKNDSASISMRLYPTIKDSIRDNNKYIEFLYTIKGNSYLLGYKVKFVGMKGIIASNTDYLTLNWSANLRRHEKSLDNERNSSTIHFKYFQDEDDYLSETKDAQKSLKTKVKWISFKQQFFTSVLIADNSFLNAEIKTEAEKTSNIDLKKMNADIGIEYNSTDQNAIGMHFYFGPNKYKILKKFNLDLEKQIPLGWGFFLMSWINIYAVLPVFNFLEGFNINYGIIILILTILLKLILFPIAYKTYISSAKMRILKPEIDEIGLKYPKKEDALKKQQATMALYKKAGANPMSGCVPMLLQFPILIAMFRFFPASIELRQQRFLWADDLSSYDSVLNLNFSIPFYGDHVSLFTLLMTISTIFYTMINNQMMSGSSQQMPGMKTMMYIMPVMFLGIFNNYSSGLSYYYLLANLLTFAQIFAIRQFVDEDKLHKQIQENKAKVVTKSSFQKRLEEMAKKRGYK